MKDPEKRKKINRYVIIAVCVLLVGYFSFMFINSNISSSNAVVTEIAREFTFEETISAEGFVVRNETLLDYSGSKVLYYTASDGEIVATGSDVALVFSNETDALNYTKYKEICKEIEVLESLNTSHDNVKTDYSAVDKQISLDIVNIISSVNSNIHAQINKSANDLIYSVNQRQIITGKVDNFDSRIAFLKGEAEKYSSAESSCVDTITLSGNTPGGYFVASADGYESVYDYDTITKLTVDSYKTDIQPKEVNKNTIGKIVSGLNWYVVCKLSADDALTLSHGSESTEVTFYNTTCKDLPMTLVALNQASKQSDAVAVFKCNYMSAPISHLRNETVQIKVNSFDGIKVSKEALHNDFVTTPQGENVKVMGVYITFGNKLEFKEVSILHSDSDFVIVDPNPAQGKLVSGETIQLNDEIVVKGEGLYAGKSVERD